MVQPRGPVCLVVALFAPVEGGAERQLRQVFDRLAAEWNHPVTVLTRALPGEPVVERKGALEVHRIGPPSWRDDPSATALPRVALAFGSELRRLRPCLVVSSMLTLETAVAGIHARRHGIPHIVRLSGGSRQVAPGEWSARVAPGSGTMRLMNACLRAGSTHVAAPTRELLDETFDARPFRGCAGHVLPNGVEILEPTKRDGAGADVVWYGRDAAVKNKAAFIQLAQSMPEVSFTALGGAALPSLENVTDVGWTSAPENYVAGVRVLVATSRFEGSPNFVLQGLALGLRVVAFDIPALRSVERQFPQHCRLVPMDDLPALRNAVTESLAQPRLPPARVTSLDDAARRWHSFLAPLL